VASGQQKLNHVRADITGAADNQDFHIKLAVWITEDSGFLNYAED
jgi:hypothetical protein